MEEMELKSVSVMGTEEKAAEIYAVMVDKLYDHFVVNRREARVDTVVQILSVLAPCASDKEGVLEASDAPKDLEEVDIL